MEQTSTICIIGLGLMGGSLALALRTARPDLHLVAVGRRIEALEEARQMGAIDAFTTDMATGVSRADVVILATPVRTILRQLPEIGRAARPGTLVLDLGSTKSAICAAMSSLPPGIDPVGGHPMCGRERGGLGAADRDLFQDRVFVLCPLLRTSASALVRARSLAETVGARPMLLRPEDHDNAVAAISHLPYLAAAALVSVVMATDEPLAWTLAASGFRDTTRVAAGEVDVMLDILYTNRQAVLRWLDAYTGQLGSFQDALMQADDGKLRELLSQVRARRADL